MSILSKPVNTGGFGIGKYWVLLVLVLKVLVLKILVLVKTVLVLGVMIQIKLYRWIMVHYLRHFELGCNAILSRKRVVKRNLP